MYLIFSCHDPQHAVKYRDLHDFLAAIIQGCLIIKSAKCHRIYFVVVDYSHFSKER